MLIHTSHNFFELSTTWHDLFPTLCRQWCGMVCWYAILERQFGGTLHCQFNWLVHGLSHLEMFKKVILGESVLN